MSAVSTLFHTVVTVINKEPHQLYSNKQGDGQNAQTYLRYWFLWFLPLVKTNTYYLPRTSPMSQRIKGRSRLNKYINSSA